MSSQLKFIERLNTKMLRYIRTGSVWPLNAGGLNEETAKAEDHKEHACSITPEITMQNFTMTMLHSQLLSTTNSFVQLQITLILLLEYGSNIRN